MRMYKNSWPIVQGGNIILDQEIIGMLEKFPEAELLGQVINYLYMKYSPLGFFSPRQLYLGPVSRSTLGTPQKAGLELHVYYKLTLSLQVAHTLRSEHGEWHRPKISSEQPCVQIGPSWRKAFGHTADSSRQRQLKDEVLTPRRWTAMEPAASC